ncbi:MAG: hypothetical protein ACR2PR_08875 [Pseudohongiellaceae bacterium]
MGYIAKPSNKTIGEDIFDAKLAGLYVAMFSRVPDTSGFNWHRDQANAWDIDSIYGRGAQFSEAIQWYAQQGFDVGYGDTVAETENMTDFITSVYTNVFGVTPPSGDVAWWLTQFNNESPGTAGSTHWHETRGELVLKMVDDFQRNDYENSGFGLSSQQITDFQNAAAEFGNKVQASLITVDQNYNPTGNIEQILATTQAAIADVTHDVDTVRTELDDANIVTLGTDEMKIVVAGQSNAANFAAASSSSHEDNLYISSEWVQFVDDNGNERPYNDLWKSLNTADGAGGGGGRDDDFSGAPAGGSMWGRVGDHIIQNGDADKVVFDTQAVGSSSVIDWGSTSSDEWLTFSSAISSSTDVVFFMQGETEAGGASGNGATLAEKATYKVHLQSFVDNLEARADTVGANLDLYIALDASYVNTSGLLVNDANIKAAQEEVIASFQSGGSNFDAGDNVTVHTGVDMSLFHATSLRNDGDLIHLDAAGQASAADNWAGLV